MRKSVGNGTVGGSVEPPVIAVRETSKSRRIDMKNPARQRALCDSCYGVTDRAAAERSGLTVGQVRYQRKKAFVSPVDWRQGRVDGFEQKIRRMEQEFRLLEKSLSQLARAANIGKERR